jgi:hypothetical protein
LEGTRLVLAFMTGTRTGNARDLLGRVHYLSILPSFGIREVFFSVLTYSSFCDNQST